MLCCLQVVSDIDDTLMCSGGSYPAGRDTRYPHNCVYPGILAFYNELDVGHVQRSEIQVRLNIGARARMLKGFACHGTGLVIIEAMPIVIVKGQPIYKDVCLRINVPVTGYKAHQPGTCYHKFCLKTTAG